MIYGAALLALLASASAWWCTGHMIVANIALDSLSPGALAEAQRLINVVDQWYPKSPDFRQAACWADDLKAEDVGIYNDWHFLNLPFVTGPIQFALSAVDSTNNAPWAVGNALKILGASASSDLDKALQLRFLIHFVGDMHQPLHVTNGYSKQFPAPEGDLGGNLFPIRGANISDLHGYYDSGAEQWSQDLLRPLAPVNASIIQTYATKIATEFPESAFSKNLTVTSPWEWAIDTYNQYSAWIYSIGVNGTVTKPYQASAQVLCRSQVALGGYRLAAALEEVLGQSFSLRGSARYADM